MLKAAITYLRGQNIPADVIKEVNIPLQGIMYLREAYAYVKGVLPAAGKVPDGAKQINIVIWTEEASGQ